MQPTLVIFPLQKHCSASKTYTDYERSSWTKMTEGLSYISIMHRIYLGSYSSFLSFVQSHRDHTYLIIGEQN